jgi:hypothetical protein
MRYLNTTTTGLNDLMTLTARVYENSLNEADSPATFTFEKRLTC